MKLRNLFKKGYGALSSNALNGPLGSGLTARPGDDSTWLGSKGLIDGPQDKISRSTYENVSAVSRCISLYADTLGALRPKVLTAASDGSLTVIDNTDLAHALYLWSFDSMSFGLWDCLATGNGFWHINKNERGGVTGFTPLAAKRVSIYIQDDKTLVYKVAPDPSVGDKEEQLLKESEVLHLMYRPGKNPLVGRSPLETNNFGLSLLYRAIYQQGEFFKNAARPGGVLSTDEILDESVTARLRQQFENLYAGKGSKYGGTAVLEQGLSWAAMTMSAADAQTTEQMKWGVEDTGREFGIPLSLLSTAEVGTNSTAAEATRNFISLTLKPFASRLSQAIEAKLLTKDQRVREKMTVAFDFTDLLIGSGRDQIEWLSMAVNKSILTPNEARRKLALSPIDDADELLIPLATADPTRWGQDSKEFQAHSLDVNIKTPEPPAIIPSTKASARVINMVDYFEGRQNNV